MKRFGIGTLVGFVLLCSYNNIASAQAAPGVFADSSHPAGAPDPEKLDSIWSVDPINGSVSITIPFTTTPQGGRGPKIPFTLSYNSASTVTLQSNGSTTIPAVGSPLSLGQTLSLMVWTTTPLGTIVGPSGPWTTSGPFFYSNQSTIPDQSFTPTNGGGTIDEGSGCTITGPYIYTDENGAAHDQNLEQSNAPNGPSGINGVYPPCAQSYLDVQTYGLQPAETSDGSALRTTVNTATSPDGTVASGSTLTDTNGNVAKLTFSGATATATDALGRTDFSTTIPIGQLGQIPAGSYSLTTTGPTGAAESYGVTFSTFSIGSFTMPHPLATEITTNYFCIPAFNCPASYSVTQPAGGSLSAQWHFPAVSQISRPDGSSYTFQYDPLYGTISKINFPTGGYVRFVWAVRAQGEGYSQFSTISDLVVTDAYTSTGSGSENHWSYNIAPFPSNWKPTSTVTSPDGSYIEYTGACFGYSTVPLYSFGSKPSCKEVSHANYSASGTLMASEAESFTSSGLPVLIATGVYDGPTPLQKVTQNIYDQYSNVVEKDESDFFTCTPSGSGLPCPLPAVSSSTPWLRSTFTQFAYQTNSSMASAYIVNKPGQIVITNGVGSNGSGTIPSSATLSSLTTYSYDTNGHGNLLYENRCLSISGSGPSPSCGSYWQTAFTYDGTGQIITKIEGYGTSQAATTTNAWTGCTGDQGNGYLCSVQHPNGATDSYTYYGPTGQIATHLDWNGKTTTYNYTDPTTGNPDPLNRIRTIVAPQTYDAQSGQTASATTTYIYTDTPGAFSVQEQHTISKTSTPVTFSTTAYFDGLGRKYEALTSSPQCSSGIETYVTFDTMSRVYSVTNPYCSLQDSTYGTTTSVYDGIGRKIQTTLPDGSVSQISYEANATETTDPPNGTTSVQHVQQVDGLGRLTNVCEVGLSPQVGVGAPACGPYISGSGSTTSYVNFPGTAGSFTTYTYNPLGEMVSVNQHGLGRSFGYDSLGRLTTSVNPEPGTDTYTYSNVNSGGACSPDPSVPCTRTDARGLITNYQYDSMSRLIGRWYSVASSNTTGPISDLSSCYQYDTRLSVVTDPNPKGQLTFEWQQPGQCPNTTVSPLTSIPSNAVAIRIRSQHDAMGRVEQDQQCLTPSGCPSSTVGNFVYSYNLAGNLVQSNNGIAASAVAWNQVASSSGNGTSMAAPSLTWTTSYDEMDHIAQANIQDQPSTSVWPASNVGAAYSFAPALIVPTNYDPFGHMTAAKLAVPVPYSSSTPGITLGRQYDNRARLISEADNGSGTASPATHSLGTITIAGAEQGPVVPASSFATATVTIGGSEQDNTFNVCPGNPHGPCNQQIPDSGTVSLTVNGITATAGYGSGSTASIIASALQAQIMFVGAPVKATVSGTQISLRTTIAGTAGNSVTISGTSATQQTQFYSSPSFTISTSGFSGGTNASPTVYDSGTITATVSGVPASITYGSTSTPQSVASALASAIQNASGSKVTAKADGDVNVLVSTATGTSTDYTASTSVSYDTTDFTQPSYMALAFAMQDGLASDSAGGLIYYYFVPSGGYAPNGNILAHSDMITGDWIYAYDAVDRLTVAVAAGNNPTAYQSMIGCWTYDAFGNRTMEAVSTTPCASNPTPQVWATYSSNNQISTTNLGTSTVTAGVFRYDASGNSQFDGVNNYWYDAEGQLCAVQRAAGGTITQYVYDAEGARIAKGTLSSAPAAGATCAAVSASGGNLTSSSGFTLSSRYLVDLGGDQVTELSGSGQWAHSNVWVAGKLTATYDTKGIHYGLTDPLGTKRVQVNELGQVDETCTGMPFGNDIGNQPGANCSAVANSLSTADDATEHHFTQRERDTETGNDYLLARYYSSALGRFTTPDWSAKTDPVPYAVFGNPQSLNLYAYTGNNPITRVDLDGHVSCIGYWCNLGQQGDPNGEAFSRHSQNSAQRAALTAAGFESKEFTFGGQSVQAYYKFGQTAKRDPNKPNTIYYGVTIFTFADSCTQCGWIQTVMSVGEHYRHVDRPGGVQKTPLYPDNSWGLNTLLDFPSTPLGTPSSKNFIATLGTINVDAKTFTAIGSIYYGYSADARGKVQGTAPVATTPQQQKDSLAEAQDEFRSWEIK